VIAIARAYFVGKAAVETADIVVPADQYTVAHETALR
jgi:hypothetical protein